MTEEEKTTLVAPWILYVTFGMLGALVLLSVVVAMYNVLDLQRFRLVSADPLIIEDTFDNTLYTDLNDGASLRVMEAWPDPLGESAHIITGDLDTIKVLKAVRDQDEEEQNHD